MSWFRRSPHRYETAKKIPHRPDHSEDQLKDEIEINRRRLDEHRQQAQKEYEDGKLH
jgi:hypothetical protein